MKVIMNKRFFIVTGAFALATAAFASVVVSNGILSSSLKALDNDYRIELTSSKNVLENGTSLASGSANAFTEVGGGTVTFGYSNIKKAEGSWAVIQEGEIHNITAINDITQLTITLNSGSLDVLFGTTNSDAVMYTSQASVTSSGDVVVPEGTSHFKFIAENANIASVLAKYECSSTIDTNSSTLNFKGDGSVNYPYEIGTLAEWNKFVSISSSEAFSGKNFKLTADIGTITNKIGSYGTGFSGTFDGNGHTVTVNWNYDSGTANQGFVGHLNATGVLKNVTINGTINSAKTSGDASIGALVGVLSGGLVENCVNNAAINIQTGCVGGIVGLSNNVNGIVRDCVNNGTITSTCSTVTNHTVGGIVGHASSKVTIEDSYNYGDIVETGVQIGGIVGKAVSCVLTNCKNYGSISTTSTNTSTANTGVAGIAGAALTSSNFTNCENHGTVAGNSCWMVGGIAGKFDGTSQFNSCKNFGNVTGLDQVGGMAGRTYGSSTSSRVTMNGCVNEGTIRALAATTGAMAGGMSGYASWCNYVNCVNGNSSDSSKGSVSTPNSTGNATENHGAGGMVGFGENASSYTSCINYGAISSKGSEVGGMTGKGCASTYSGCTNYGALTGRIYVGGIVGRAVTTCSFTNNTNHGDLNVTLSTATATQYGQIYGDTAQTVTDGGGNTGDGAVNIGA